MADPALYSLDDLSDRDFGVLTQLDPHLQRTIIQSLEVGETRDLTASPPAPAVVPVIARVTDEQAWIGHESVRHICSSPTLDAGHFIVTGRVAASSLENLRREPFVVSLKASQRVSRQLKDTVPDLGAATLPPASLSNGGQGVLVGIVDLGCDFANRNFRDAGGQTRLIGIWDQNKPQKPTDVSQGVVKFGRFITAGEINAALTQLDPYTAVDYSPEIGAHGTHVTDIAAGNGLGTGQAGVAPRADLLFVDLSTSDVPAAVNHGIGDSVHLVEAVQFLFQMAGDRPCVVNISLGTNSGPHDGSSLVEQMIDSLTAEKPNRSVVIAAGNAFADKVHASGNVPPGGAVDLDWQLDDPIPEDAELEIWCAGSDRFSTEVIAPNGRSMVTATAGTTKTMVAHGAVTTIMAASRLSDPNNHDNQIGVFLAKGLQGGTWKVRLHGAAVTSGAFHAWIERDDADQSAFSNAPSDNTHTISSLGGGRNTIVVGAYDAHHPANTIFFESSSGPTRDNRQKPDISAPGVAVAAAKARTPDTIAYSGTSMAAPAVAGTVALLLSEVSARGLTLRADEIRGLLMSTARANPPVVGPAGPSDPRYGVGRASAQAAIAAYIGAHPIAVGA